MSERENDLGKAYGECAELILNDVVLPRLRKCQGEVRSIMGREEKAK